MGTIYIYTNIYIYLGKMHDPVPGYWANCGTASPSSWNTNNVKGPCHVRPVRRYRDCIGWRQAVWATEYRIQEADCYPGSGTHTNTHTHTANNEPTGKSTHRQGNKWLFYRFTQNPFPCLMRVPHAKCIESGNDWFSLYLYVYLYLYLYLYVNEWFEKNEESRMYAYS